MSKAGKVRILLTIAFGLIFVVVFLTFIIRPDSNRCKIFQIEKNWDVDFDEQDQLIYSKQSGFSIFGEGHYYSIIQVNVDSNFKEEYSVLAEKDIKTISDWYSSCGLDIEEDFQYTFGQQVIGKILKKEDDTAIILVQVEKNQIFVLQCFR